jgi:VanZ family protein
VIGRLLVWVPAATWAAVLFFLSSRDTLPVDLGGGLDKVAHFGAYLVLGFLLAFGANRLSLPLWLAVVLGFAYGLLDELHQSTVPGRHADLGDWIADAAGTLAGVLLFVLVIRIRKTAPLKGRGEPAEVSST